jgi:uncharacterized protein
MIDLDALLLSYGEAKILTAAGALVGALFGVVAQRSRFCMRSAVIDCCQRERSAGHSKLAVWLLAFASAVVLTQLIVLLGAFDDASVRQLTTPGSLSGAIVGGLLLGAGMILARGCPSRMLVLTANGNLRALLTGLFFVVTAQATVAGVLVPVRDAIAALWPVASESRNLLVLLGIEHLGGVGVGLLWLIAALIVARRSRLPLRDWLGGIGVGVSVALAWWLTYELSVRSFDLVIAVQAVSFTNPSVELLMWLLAGTGSGLNFGVGLIAGVLAGSLLASVFSGEFRLEGFRTEHSVPRYLTGAAAMGLGGVLATGCAVGAGVSGASVFSLTAWLALGSMWLAAALTHLVLDA